MRRSLWTRAAERRKFEQLRFLFSYVPPRLAEFGVAPDVIDAFVESPRVEFERAKLYSGEGGRLAGISHGAPKISSLLSESKRRIQAVRVCCGGLCANPASAEFLSATRLVWPPQLRTFPKCIRQSGAESISCFFSTALSGGTRAAVVLAAGHDPKYSRSATTEANPELFRHRPRAVTIGFPFLPGPRGFDDRV